MAPKVRRCSRCGFEKLAENFVRGGRTCAECKAVRDEGVPRACFGCHEVKPASSFSFGDGSRGRGEFRRRRPHCIDCVAEREREKARRAAARKRVTFEGPDGRMVRRCSGCGEVKDLERDFYNTRKPLPGQSLTTTRSYRCKPCSVARVSAAVKRREADPVEGPKLRAQRVVWQRSWRERNVEAYREAQRRYEARVRADPRRHAQRLENARIAHRLKREREGLPTRDGLSSATMGHDSISHMRLPAAPLVAMLDERLVGASNIDAACRSLGISERQLHRWRVEAEGVTFRAADVVLTHAGRHVWDVWPESEFPEVHEALFSSA